MKCISLKDLTPLLRQRFHYDDLIIKNGELLRPRRVEVVLKPFLSTGNQVLSLHLPGRLRVLVRLFELSTNSFNKNAFSTEYSLENATDLAPVLDELDRWLRTDVFYRPLEFDDTTYRCNKTNLGFYATHTNGIGSAEVNEVVGLTPAGVLAEPRGHDPWFLVSCHTPLGDFFQLLFNGDHYLFVSPERRLTHVPHPQLGLDFRLNRHDQELLSFLMARFVENNPNVDLTT